MSSGITEESTSHFITIQEGGKAYRLHYNDTLTGTDVVVMLHGSGPGASGWANFHRNIEPLASAGFRVILMDCLGWSKSDSILCAESRSELNARCLLQLMDTLNINKAHIIGNSMGAHSTTAFALANPGRVGKLILMGGGTGGPSLFTPMPAEGIKLIGQLYRNPTIENHKRMMEVFVFDTSSLSEDLYEQRLSNILARPEHLQNFVRSLQAFPKQFTDYGYRMDEIQAETLIIWGRNDRFVPLDVGLRALANLPNAQMHIFNKCGHWAQWEHAEAFNRLTLDFFTH